MPTQSSIIDDSLDLLDREKQSFQNRVSTAVCALIKATSRNDCVALTRRYHAKSNLDANAYMQRIRSSLSSGANPVVKLHGDVWVCEWQVRMFGSNVDAWVKCFTAMIKHKGPELPKYKDTYLDSYLSQPILQRVQEIWAEFMKDHSEVVSATTVKMLANDPNIARKLAEQIVSSMQAAGKPMTDELRQNIVQFLTEQVSGHVAGESVNQMTTQVGHAAGHAAMHSIAAGVGAALMHALAVALAHSIAHAGLTTAAKSAAMSVAGHMIAHTVIATSVTALLTTLGISVSGAAYAFVLLPIVIAFATYEAHEFPEKLAKKVAPAVALSVTGKFREGNKSTLEKIFQDAVKGKLQALAETIVADSDLVQEIVKGSTTETTPLSVCTPPSGYTLPPVYNPPGYSPPPLYTPALLP